MFISSKQWSTVLCEHDNRNVIRHENDATDRHVRLCAQNNLEIGLNISSPCLCRIGVGIIAGFKTVLRDSDKVADPIVNKSTGFQEHKVAATYVFSIYSQLPS